MSDGKHEGGRTANGQPFPSERGDLDLERVDPGDPIQQHHDERRDQGHDAQQYEKYFHEVNP
jgi:hypothetical protein